MATIVQQANRGKLIVIAYVLLVWLTVVLMAALAGFFAQQLLKGIPVQLGIAITVPVLLFGAGYLFSETFRSFVRSVAGDPWTITILQVSRVVGAAFVIQVANHALAPSFGLTAGWGDVLVGVTAPLAAMAWASGTRAGKAGFVIWNLLGILDLVTAISLGVLSPILQPEFASPTSLLNFPLILIPAFGVPLALILHITGLAQYRYLSRK